MQYKQQIAENNSIKKHHNETLSQFECFYDEDGSRNHNKIQFVFKIDENDKQDIIL